MQNVRAVTFFLIVSLLTSHNNTGCVPLGAKSWVQMGVSTALGAAAGTSLLLFDYWNTHNRKLPDSWKTDFVSQRPQAVIIACLLGGTLAGGLWYRYLPESYLNYAHKGYNTLVKDPLFMLLTKSQGKNVLTILKDYFFREKLPLIIAFNVLENIYDSMQEYFVSLQTVLNSDRIELHPEALRLLNAFNVYSIAVKEAIKVLKEDPDFINQYNSHLQAQNAAAMQSAASAAWVNALKPNNQTIIVH